MTDVKEYSIGGLLTRFQLIACLLLLGVVLLFEIPPLVEALTVILVASVTGVIITTPLTILAARLTGALDRPSARRIHSTPTPRLGGLPISFGVMLALVLVSMNFMPNLRSLLIGSFLVMLVGVLDDIRPVPAGVKLVFQLIACAFLISDGVHILFLPPTWWGMAGRWIITAVWIIGITNAVNFLDGMDGLVSGLVVGTGLIYFFLSSLLGSNMLAYCSVALADAAFGFLGFNVKPARIFLGDGGSTFFGFFLAALSVQGSWARNNPLVSFFIPIMVLSVPIYDMIFTTVARILSGRVRSFRGWLEYTGKDHLHHRLEALGLSRGYVVTVICFLNLAVGFGAIALFEAQTYGAIALLIQVACIYVIFAVLEIMGRKHRNGLNHTSRARRLERRKNQG